MAASDATAIGNAADMAVQLEPLLGPWARVFFAAGLLAAGLTSAITAPLAAAYATAGALGWPTDEPFHVPDEVYDRAFIHTSALQKRRPDTSVPTLLKRVQPVHEVIEVDLFLQGCPPPPDAIYQMLVELLAGQQPDTTQLSRFGL